MMEKPMATALVTGGTGFIGSHLVRRLLTEGVRVHLFIRPESSYWRIRDILAKVTLWQGNLLDPTAVQHCLQGSNPDVIFHLAGTTEGRSIDPQLSQLETSIDTNIKGTLNLIQAVHQSKLGVQCLIRTGGLEEYGTGAAPYHEAQREQPVSPYSASQVATTHYCQMLQPYLSFSVVTVRLALVYGAAQSTRFFIPSLITHCLKGQDFAMTSGAQTRDLIYVDDVVTALLKTARTPGLNGEIINIGTGIGHPIRDVAQKILKLTQADIDLKIGDTSSRTAEIQQLYCQIDKARELLGWLPTTDLDTGLTQTIAWFEHQQEAANH
jgi:nucleoside-diphosphate-sugar epimerase